MRSSCSVGSNTRASFRARSKKEFVAKIGVVVEEADESLYWLEIIRELNISKSNELKELFTEANELTAILNSIKNKYKKAI